MSDMQSNNSGQDTPKSETKTTSEKEQMYGALGRLGRPLDVLTFLGGQLHSEQSHFWSRWAALAALHAGLLVMAGETSGWARMLTALVGMCPAVVWLTIQNKSRKYVERWKPYFHS